MGSILYVSSWGVVHWSVGCSEGQSHIMASDDVKAKKDELNTQLKDYITQWRDERSKEEEELKRLKEKQAHHDLFQFNALEYSSVDKNIDGDMKSEVEKDFIDLGSSQLRQRKEKEIEQLASKQIEHPPSWLEDDHSLHEFIQSFIDESCQ